jgi:type II secretory pathway component GspD/PulD (secretin)
MILVLLTTMMMMMMTGCAQKSRFYFGNENPFKTRLVIDNIETKNPSLKDLYPEGETPIVKIIKGDIVDEADAKKMITAEDAPGFKGMSEKIRSLILKDVPVRQIAELLTELCGYNVVPTKLVENQKINIFMQNIDLRTALETICRLNNLWYREGNNIITLMTRQEYVKDIEIRQSEHTRAFYIKYTNAADMAKIIQSLMGEEVYLSAIEDEKIYGHVDPEEDISLTGEYDGPELDNESSQRIIFMNNIISQTVKPAPTDKGEGEPNKKKAAKSRVRSKTGNKPLLAVLTVFKRNNCIIVRSLDAGLLNEMAKIIETLDTPTSQVLLEVKILQITLGDDFESFFKLDYGDFGQTVENRNNPPETILKGGGLNLLEGAAMSASTVGAVFNSNNIRARVALFESEGRANTISSPFLMCANNSTVDFFVGEEVPLRDDVKKETITIGDSGQTINTFIVDIKREELGTSIDMSTFINEDNTVTLEIETEISSAILNYSSIGLADDFGNIINFPLDGISKSEIKSILTTKSGQTIALGGIIRETIDNNETQVPILGDIPGLGFFFKHKKNTKKKTETIVILTPHIITHPGFSGAKTADFLNRKTSNEMIKEKKESLLTD